LTRTRGFFDALAFSSLWLAAAAGALVAAASLAMGADVDPRALLLATTGTLVVYNVDRLRDVERDRQTRPERSAFVDRHRVPLVALSAVSGLGAAAAAAAADLCATAVLAPALAAGLAHRRLKHFRAAKPLYIVAAWLLVVVALPWCLAPAPAHAGWVAAMLGAAILANAVASNVRDGETLPLLGASRALNLARAVALLGALLALVAPEPVRALAVVPGVTLLVLLPFRPSERYGLLGVDGALLAGALLAAALP
jgi:hypothetical protein